MNAINEINNISNYFLSKMTMSNKKLQKMLYYAFSWYIVNNNDNEEVKNVLFNEIPEAWIHGPVFPTIYYKYKSFGYAYIFTEEKNVELPVEISGFLDEIIEVFGKYSADQLELMTHNEDPWKNARAELSNISRSSNKINLKDIFNFYSTI